MSIPVLAQTTKPEIIPRRTATFHPSIWGDRFLNHDSQDNMRNDRTKQQVEELKEVVSREVFRAAHDSSKKLQLIDAIQRLCLSYHFEREIDEALQQIYDTYQHHVHDGNLYNVALCFRLLRQHGYNVSSDLFEKFKDESGKFKESLIGDISGMLAFYEASHLRLHGEDTLEEALVFTTTHLMSVASEKTDRLSEQIRHALNRPLRKSLERLQARLYLSIYQDDASHNKALLELAKLDFNILQSLHKEELAEILRWWKELDFYNKLPYIRDRIVELYVWILGVYFEPQYSLGRKILTKVIAMTSVIDDTYDSYGTFEELQLFTEAIERWDINFKEQLPEYMQLIYQTLLNVYQEIEEDMEEEEKYRVHYAKEAIKSVVRAYFEEARWLEQGHTPSLEEYLKVALVSTGYFTLSTTSFVGIMEDNIITKDVFEWVFSHPKIVKASEFICRFMDDIVSHKFEQEREHVASSVECYTKQYGVSEQEAYGELNKKVVDAWKDINEELLINPTAMPRPVLIRVLNLSRVIDLLYKDGDGYTHVGKVTRDSIATLLIDSVPV
uniref:Cadinene synthase n=2 Tax=Ficus carica TaxID=3494 RepID=A0A7L7S5T2_FICCA|nr:cadinene synthase [Ficus carica]